MPLFDPETKEELFSKERFIPVIISVIVIGGLVLAYFFITEVNNFAKEAWNVLTSDDKQRIKNWVSNFGAWGPLILLGAFIVQMFAFVIPSWLLMIVSILAYGPFWGSLIALSGILIAATLAYIIGDFLSEYTLERFLGKKSQRKMKRYLKDYGFWSIVVFRLAPFLSNDTISFVAGLVEMKYRKFILATFFGITPLIILISYLGGNTKRLEYGLIWASAISIVGLIIYIWWDRKHEKVSNEDHS